jgi:hypothetical protein
MRFTFFIGEGAGCHQSVAKVFQLCAASKEKEKEQYDDYNDEGARPNEPASPRAIAARDDTSG